ncbi:kinase-like domain-containing protein [Cercophora scortea]|uniref:Kinase-like domain-containing protein n=1 Tax=Cercophora scortea TaxID=314031 RepID=A0AAE0MK86_9PEZI|nr:kinase-like domain-containing protein [Cercophora scortea]
MLVTPALLKNQQWHTEHFKWVRAGVDDYETESRYEKPHPSEGPWPWPGWDHVTEPAFDEEFGKRFTTVPNAMTAGEKLRKRKARRQTFNMIRRVARRLKPLRFDFRKVLGWGGNGVASLFEFTDESGRKQLVVVKYSIRATGEDVDMDGERMMMEIFDKHPHMIRITEFEKPEMLTQKKLKGGTLGEQLIFMEYCERGSLEGVLAKHADAAQDPIPDYILWCIFDCFFRMTIAMAWPRRVMDDFNYQDEQNMWLRGEEVEETIPPEDDPRHKKPERIMHFDIDPKNIFVGKFSEDPLDPHWVAPTLKLADFGLMTTFDHPPKKVEDIRTLDPVEYWDTRVWGKQGLLSPEQFTREWDFVTYIPAIMDPPARVAGQFTWKTNLYQLGYTMWMLITRHDRAMMAQRTKLPDSDPNGGGRWTYGGWLNSEQFAAIDPDLRKLVVRCMMDDPADRPEMQELQKIIRRKVTVFGRDRRMHMRMYRQSAEEVFGEPPGVRAHALGDLDAWLDGQLKFPPGYEPPAEHPDQAKLDEMYKKMREEPDDDEEMEEEEEGEGEEGGEGDEHGSKGKKGKKGGKGKEKANDQEDEEKEEDATGSQEGKSGDGGENEDEEEEEEAEGAGLSERAAAMLNVLSGLWRTPVEENEGDEKGGGSQAGQAGGEVGGGEDDGGEEEKEKEGGAGATAAVAIPVFGLLKRLWNSGRREDSSEGSEAGWDEREGIGYDSDEDMEG